MSSQRRIRQPRFADIKEFQGLPSLAMRQMHPEIYGGVKTMPLIRGKSKSTVRRNVREMVRNYERTGKIGNTRPRDVQHAEKIATAAAHNKARGTKKRR